MTKIIRNGAKGNSPPLPYSARTKKQRFTPLPMLVEENSSCSLSPPRHTLHHFLKAQVQEVVVHIGQDFSEEALEERLQQLEEDS